MRIRAFGVDLRAREIRIEMAVALAVAAGVAALAAAGVLRAPERAASDAALRFAAAYPPPPTRGLPDVAVVAIDPQSLRALPNWPWPRSVYATLIEELDAAGAAAIAFDIDFSTARDPAADAAFAQAIARSGRVVLAGFRQFQDLAGAQLEVASLPLPMLVESSAALGSVMVPVDADGVVRRAPRAIEVAGRPLPTLAAAALAVASDAPAPVETDERFAIDYRHSGTRIPLVPLAEVVEGGFDASQVAGRVVLIGATAAELQDLWNTPLAPAWPGVMIQAVAYRTLAAELRGEPVLRSAGAPLRFGVLFAALLATALLGARSHARRVLVGVSFALGVIACSLFVLVEHGLWLDPVAPSAALGLHDVLGLEVGRRRVGRQVAERELSLAAVARVGEASSRVTHEGGLDLGLGLLGDVVGASAVTLYRATPQGALDGRKLAWSPRGSAGGDLDLAREVFSGESARVFEGRIPGAGDRAGAAVYAPLRAGEMPVGVLVVEREGVAEIDALQLRTCATVGAQIAMSAANLRLVDELRASFETSVEAIAGAIEARDGYTELHCRRLAIFSATMADRIGLPEEEIEAIRLGALLHDVGKIGIRDDVLLKPGRFTPEERRAMEEHTAIGERIVRPISGITDTTLCCVRHHHERWDGNGYPDALGGEAIPLGARIVSVVDVWDALSTARPYKPAFPQDRVLSILEKGRGVEFDPEIVDLFFAVLAEEGEEMLALVAESAGGNSA